MFSKATSEVDKMTFRLKMVKSSICQEIGRKIKEETLNRARFGQSRGAALPPRGARGEAAAARNEADSRQ